IPAWVEPVTVHTTIVSKNRPSCCSCRCTSLAQFTKPRPPSRWSEAPAGIGYGVPPLDRMSFSAASQLCLMPIPKAGLHQFDLGAHGPRQQDVADPVIHGIGPVDPALLHQPGGEAELGRNR